MGEFVGLCRIGEAKISDLSTEVMGVGTPSVETVIVGRDDRSQHFALATTQRRGTMHDCPIHIH